jgi:uncharacterized damage-inducible protein DinB
VAITAVTAFSQSQHKKDLVMWLDDAAEKLVQLAEAMPQEKFSWRPAEGVRSFSEVCLHAASANFFFPSIIGIKSEVMIDQEMTKKVQDKKKIISLMKDSFDHVRKAINDTPDEEYDKMTKMFGSDASYRSVFLLALSHNHEHLGQAIAYARMNGVVPPWSQGQ